MAHELIAYYSRAGENYVGGEIRCIEVGNTKVAAQMLSPAQAAPKTALQARRFRRPLARTTAAMLHTT